MTDRAVPNLPSRDLDRTLTFYGGFGFDAVYQDEGWLILRRGELELEFFLFAELAPESSSFMCSIRVDEVDELYRQILATGVAETDVGAPRLRPVQMQPWGHRAGFLVDIDGTQLHLIENST
jgi:catechol 2,3-dioxygenase-like lactoylglutathione lyase family enzyme